jgi:hypothetical protein
VEKYLHSFTPALLYIFPASTLEPPLAGGRFFDPKAGFKAILKRAGLTGITWHTLRHAFGFTADAFRC